jgi:hypothetical protein
VDCLFLMGLAALAARNFEQGRAELLSVLELDRNHLAAMEELRAIDASIGHKSIAARF